MRFMFTYLKICFHQLVEFNYIQTSFSFLLLCLASIGYLSLCSIGYDPKLRGATIYIFTFSIILGLVEQYENWYLQICLLVPSNWYQQISLCATISCYRL
jgi:hypothetical protein